MLCVQHRRAFASPGLLPFSSHHLRCLITCSWNVHNPNIPVTGLIKCNIPHAGRGKRHLPRSYRSISFEEEEESSLDSSSDHFLRFEEAVKLFNGREYYACHDLLESLWFDSYDPLRTLLHALLQCAVAFYHLFNQNHKGAMMEMGESLCKLRKLNLEGGPFHQFEQELSTVLNFIYQTQLELAACTEDFCLTMEQTERSYQLLEGYGAGQRLYFLEESDDENHNNHLTYLVFDPRKSYGATSLPPTKLESPTELTPASLNPVPFIPVFGSLRTHLPVIRGTTSIPTYLEDPSLINHYLDILFRNTGKINHKDMILWCFFPIYWAV